MDHLVSKNQIREAANIDLERGFFQIQDYWPRQLRWNYTPSFYAVIKNDHSRYPVGKSFLKPD